jgi:hypothetical protein
MNRDLDSARQRPRQGTAPPAVRLRWRHVVRIQPAPQPLELNARREPEVVAIRHWRTVRLVPMLLWDRLNVLAVFHDPSCTCKD